MSTNDAAGNQASGTTAQLPPAIGVDADGRVHHVAPMFATYAFVRDPASDEIVSHDLDGRDRRAWLAHVSEAVGWREQWVGERLSPAEIEARIAAARRDA
jgi:hypothetical protein